MSLKKNIVYNVSLNVLNICFPIVTVPYVSRVLGVEPIGLMNFVTTYAGYFALLAMLGIPTYGVREIAKFKNDLSEVNTIFSELFSISIVSTILSSFIFVGTVLFIPTLTQDKAILLIAGISLYLAPLSIDWYFQGVENFRIITIRSLFVKLLCLGGLFIFVRRPEDVVVYVLINVCAVVFANAWNLYYGCQHGLKIRLTQLRAFRHFKSIIVLFSTTVAISIFVMLDTLMLGFMSTFEQVGVYTSSVKIIKLVIIVFSSIGMVLIPRLAFNKQNGDIDSNHILLQKSFDFSIFVGIPCVVGIFLISPRFVPFFFGAEFMGAVTPMKILSFLMVFIMMNNFFGLQILVGLGYESKFLIAVCVAAFLNLAINFMLIPIWGAIGASVASVIAEGIQMILNIFFVWKCMPVKLQYKPIIQAVISTIPFVIFYCLLSDLLPGNLWFLLAFSSCCLITYFVIQFFVMKNRLLCEHVKFFRR